MRRFVDAVVASVMLVLVAPIALLTALMILVSSGRPVLFRQPRSGRNGKEFLIVKFRSMEPELYEDQPDAERQTKVGEFLRASGLDEIPQLWNIIKGDMGFIGPRPGCPDQVACYDSRQRGRLVVRPGVTGWAQVNGRNSITWPQRIELDLWYIQHRGVLLDLRILAMTVTSVLIGRGVRGEGGVNPEFPATGAPAPSPVDENLRPRRESTTP